MRRVNLHAQMFGIEAFHEHRHFFRWLHLTTDSSSIHNQASSPPMQATVSHADKPLQEAHLAVLDFMYLLMPGTSFNMGLRHTQDTQVLRFCFRLPTRENMARLEPLLAAALALVEAVPKLRLSPEQLRRSDAVHSYFNFYTF